MQSATGIGVQLENNVGILFYGESKNRKRIFILWYDCSSVVGLKLSA